MNEIKSNCMYSEKEIARDKFTMDRINVNSHERKVLEKIWNLRQKLGKELLVEAEKLIEELE